MTTSIMKEKYESIVSGTQLIESSLHKHIVEHLNAEIVLGTITDISIAMEWLKATYLYQRVFKNPKHYDLCIKELNGLRKHKLIYMDDDSFNLQPTDTGRLMAKYYLTFETMKNFSTLTGNESLSELLALVSSCKELEDIQLRVNEKKFLNELNKSKTSSVRFPLQGKIKTRGMKINCLAQATFGCMPISDPTFNQDIAKIFKSGVRISKCLSEYLSFDMKGFSVLYNAIILAKCFKARLWENSKYVARQLDKIGVTLSTILVNAGITSFDSILNTNPREIELILNRNPPFGSIVADSAKYLPKYDVEAEQAFLPNNECSVCVTVFLRNAEHLELQRTAHDSHGFYILIGDADNNVIVNKRIRDCQLLQIGRWVKKFDVPKSQKDELHIHLISESYVGLDVHRSFAIQCSNPLKYNSREEEIKPKKIQSIAPAKGMRNCNHKCFDKSACGHSCCKMGVNLPKTTEIQSFMQQIQNKLNSFPSKKIKVGNTLEADGREINKMSLPEQRRRKQEVEYSRNVGTSEEWNNYIGDCYGPAFDKMWEDEANTEETWDDEMNTMELEPTEENEAINDKISFDLDFNDSIYEEEMPSVEWGRNTVHSSNMPLTSELGSNTSIATSQHNAQTRNFDLDSNDEDAMPVIGGKNKENTYNSSSSENLEIKQLDKVVFQHEVWPREKYTDDSAWQEVLDNVVNYLLGKS